MNKHYSFAKFLLDRGADPNLADVKGRAALYAAIDMRNEDYSALPARKGDDPAAEPRSDQGAARSRRESQRAVDQNLPGRSGMDAGDTALARAPRL